jgi:hypothetical protein
MLKKFLGKLGYVPEERLNGLEDSLDKTLVENKFLKLGNEITAPEVRAFLSDLYKTTLDVKKLEGENKDLLKLNRQLTDLTYVKSPADDKLHKHLYNQTYQNLKDYVAESRLQQICDNTFNLNYYSAHPNNLVLVDSMAVIIDSENKLNDLMGKGELLLTQSILRELFYNQHIKFPKFIKKTSYFVPNDCNFPLMYVPKERYDVLKQECSRENGKLEKADLQFRVLVPNLLRRMNSPVLNVNTVNEALEFSGNGKNLRFVSFDNKLIDQILEDYKKFVRFGL